MSQPNPEIEHRTYAWKHNGKVFLANYKILIEKIIEGYWQEFNREREMESPQMADMESVEALAEDHELVYLD